MATAPRSADTGSSILETAAPVISAAEARALHVDPAQAATVAATPATGGEGEEEEPYYWEPGGDTTAPVPKVIAHNLHWLGLQLFTGVEFVGEVFAEFFGMTNPRYEWAIQAAREQEEEAEAEERREAERKRWEMIQRMNTMERQGAQNTETAASAPSQPAGADATTVAAAPGSTPVIQLGADNAEAKGTGVV